VRDFDILLARREPTRALPRTQERNVKGKIIIRCPEMSVLATTNPLIRECQKLFCPDNEILFDDGTRMEFEITFPPARVRFQRPGEWLVDFVPAYGRTRDGGLVFVLMEKERVSRTTWRTMVAQPCPAYGLAEIKGRLWNVGPVVHPTGEKTFFPKCTTTATGLGLIRYVAEPVVAEGVVTLSGGC
jgi:hypothetical protein